MPTLPKTKVYVVPRCDRGHWRLRWKDPATRRWCERRAMATRRGDAEREAGELERELRPKRTGPEVPWPVFRRRLEEERFALQPIATRRATDNALRSLERWHLPDFLAEVDTAFLSRWTAHLWSQHLAKASIRSYLQQVQAALGWAARVFPGYVQPKIERPKLPRSKRGKGRPITAEEFERMLEVVPTIRLADVGLGVQGAMLVADGESWQWLLRGLYLGGRRLGQTLALTWDRHNGPHLIGVGTDAPMIVLPAEDEKGRQELLVPIMPDFAAMLASVPEERRRGRVFRPTIRGKPVNCRNNVSRMLSAVGRAARVVVACGQRRNRKTGAPEEWTKFASAHDLRRSFGTRWAPHVKSAILQILMGHKDIKTTMQYYVEIDAADLSRQLRQSCGQFCGTAGGATVAAVP